MLKAILFPLTVLATVACFFSAGAAAESLVPPGNSAASQYTETFPTSKGEEDEQGKKKSGVTPTQVLGAGKAHQLEDKGPTGKKVAEFAAETSPTAVPVAGSEEAATGDGKSRTPKHGSKPGASDGAGEQSEGAAGAAGQPSGGGSGGSGGAGARASGSSGLGEVISQATGTSSGSLGLLLPLTLIAVVIWSAAYVWRNRQQRVV